MKIVKKAIKEDGSKYIVYVTDLVGSPLACEYATDDNMEEIIKQLTNEFGEILEFEEMTYNEYINQ
jgi:hypothetical protein